MFILIHPENSILFLQNKHYDYVKLLAGTQTTVYAIYAVINNYKHHHANTIFISTIVNYS